MEETHRKLGHNKLQLEIQKLNDDLLKERVANDEKEMKLGLFKKTISNLQQQLQNKHTEYQELLTKLNDNTIPKIQDDTTDDIIKDLNNNINIHLETISNKDSEILQLNNKIKELDLQLIDSKNNNNILSLNFDKQTHTLQNQTNINYELESNLKKLENINENLKSEIISIKDELNYCKQDKQDIQIELDSIPPIIINKSIEVPITNNQPIGNIRKKVTRGDKRR